MIDVGGSADQANDPVKEVFMEVITKVNQLSDFLSEDSLGRIAKDRAKLQKMMDTDGVLERPQQIRRPEQAQDADETQRQEIDLLRSMVLDYEG